MTRQWLRQYRDERGSFRQLSLVTRGIFREILGLTNDDGVIELGTKSPVDAVAFALGATRADRRSLRVSMAEMLADGCLEHVGTTLVAPNFAHFQNDEPKPKRPRRSAEPATTEPPNDHFATTKNDLSVRNDALAHNVLSSDQKSRVEESRESARTLAVTSFKKRWEAARKAMWPGTKGDPNWDLLAKFLVETAKLRGTTVEALLERKLDGWFADPYVIGKNHPTENFARYPEKHIDAENAPNVATPKVLSPERQELSAAVEAVERARGTSDEYAAVERHRAAKRAVAMSERPTS